MNTSQRLTHDNLAQGLRNARANKTQSDLSEIAHVTVPTISAIENGNGDPKVSTVLSLINELEVSPNDLFNYSEEITLANVAKALLVLYFCEGVNMQYITSTDNRGQKKRMVQITITQGDLRRILSEFLSFKEDRKRPSDIFETMIREMDKLKNIKAWTKKDISLWWDIVEQMSGWRNVTGVSELALKRFFFGGKLWTEYPDPHKFTTDSADIDCYRRHMFEGSRTEPPCCRDVEMELRRIYVLDQIRSFLNNSNGKATMPYKEALDSFLKASQLSESDLKGYFSEIGFSKKDIEKILEGDV